jgi:hypothetical protein
MNLTAAIRSYFESIAILVCDDFDNTFNLLQRVKSVDEGATINFNGAEEGEHVYITLHPKAERGILIAHPDFPGLSTTILKSDKIPAIKLELIDLYRRLTSATVVKNVDSISSITLQAEISYAAKYADLISGEWKPVTWTSPTFRATGFSLKVVMNDLTCTINNELAKSTVIQEALYTNK